VGGALTDAVWIFAVALALIVLAAVILASRRYLVERNGGTVECGLRRLRGHWRLGILSYQHDELCWYGAVGVLLRPEQVFKRRALSVVSRRPADLSEAAALGADRIVIEISTRPAGASSANGAANGAAGGQPAPDRVELAMTEEALTGFLAWLEASPPGSHMTDIAGS